MASSREDWQAIGKRRQAVGKRLEGRSNSSQTIVKQWSNGRRDQGAGAENCGVGNAAENSRRTSLGNLLASHRGEVRPKAAEVQNHSRYGNCSFSPSFPALAPSPSPRYGGVEPGSKSGPPPSFPNDPIGNPGALGLGSINSVIAIIQRHWIPDWIIRGRRYKKDFHSPPSGSSGKFPAMRSGQIPQRPKDVNSPRVYSSQIPRPCPCPLRQLHYCFTRHVWSQFHNCFTQDEAEPWLLLHFRLNSKQMHVSCEFS